MITMKRYPSITLEPVNESNRILSVNNTQTNGDKLYINIGRESFQDDHFHPCIRYGGGWERIFLPSRNCNNAHEH